MLGAAERMKLNNMFPELANLSRDMVERHDPHSTLNAMSSSLVSRSQYKEPKGLHEWMIAHPFDQSKDHRAQLKIFFRELR